ncbi:alpha/beta hydrolase [Rhodococcus sp. IEGM 1381]|uniref:alpha/beta fold hydrolase n=1 Tax=Rhodococcus sp. IEGM 1381 TaxID=3047085 RepID=UPI0024B73F9C|nr:alpha/beta hydrolase [Rhodococcus sp. IEGM 1381]
MCTRLHHTRVPISDGTIHVVESGPVSADPIVFLHGWPEDWSAWTQIMELAGDKYRCIALDLPGVGGSRLVAPRGDKFYLAGLIHELITALDLQNVTLVGHDAGGMVTFAYLKQFLTLRSAIIMDTVIPGIPPWESALTNPYIWHFAFHSIPALPEKLVQNNVRSYFDYFYDAISANPEAIPEPARNRYAASYTDPGALTQGFEFYRAFRTDADDNNRSTDEISTPTLYLRGSSEGGNLADYATGFRNAGLTNLNTGTIESAGHFAPEEAPEQVWKAITSHLAQL